MELHQLQYFRAVSEEQSFTRAAERLFVTQPNISVQIRKLEREIGATLFDRSRGSVTLSAAGEILYDCAQSIFETLETAKSRIGALETESTPTLRIGYLPSLSGNVLPALVTAVLGVVPETSLVLHEIADSVRIDQMLVDDELDVGVARLPKAAATLSSRVLLSEEFVAVCPDQGPLRDRNLSDITAFATTPFVIPSKGIGLRDQILEICQLMGFEPAVALEAQGLDLLIGAVARGVGISVLPRLCLERENHVTSVELGHPQARRSISLVWRRNACAFRQHDQLEKCLTHSDFIPFDESIQYSRQGAL